LDDEDGTRQLFILGDEAVPSLTKFLSDPNEEQRASAARSLAYIGNPEGILALRNAIQSEQNKEAKSEMSCFLAGGLVDTSSDSDLSVLRTSVEAARFTDDDDDSSLVALSAALALGMIGKSDSLPILRKVAKQDSVAMEEIAKAIRWIENKPARKRFAARTSATDEELVKNVVLKDTLFAEKEGDETSVTQITFNRGKDRALISLEIHRNLHTRSKRLFAYGYDVVLAKREGEWKPAGIWFTWIT
jgi:PBS lyase HEAT-like repeat